jgi:hypothetical protein
MGLPGWQKINLSNRRNQLFLNLYMLNARAYRYFGFYFFFYFRSKPGMLLLTGK